jgi:hypothetical protein
MRTTEEIQAKIQEVAAKLGTNISFKKREVIDAILDVLEKEMEYEQIEETYFDEHKTDRESSANTAREWLDGDIEEFDF